MKKKAIVVMLCVGLTLGILAGCGSQEKTASENTEAAGEEKSGEESEDTGEEESETAQDNSTEQTDAPDETAANIVMNMTLPVI